MLENYGFPWGNKRKLQWALEASDKALRCERNALRQLERQYWELKEEVHEVHLHKLQPIVEQATDMTDMSVFTDTLVEFDEEVLSVRMSLRRFKCHEHNAMDYTRRVIDKVAYMLINKLTTRIAEGLRQRYLQLKGDKGDF